MKKYILDVKYNFKTLTGSILYRTPKSDFTNNFLCLAPLLFFFSILQIIYMYIPRKLISFGTLLKNLLLHILQSHSPGNLLTLIVIEVFSYIVSIKLLVLHFA